MIGLLLISDPLLGIQSIARYQLDKHVTDLVEQTSRDSTVLYRKREQSQNAIVNAKESL